MLFTRSRLKGTLSGRHLLPLNEGRDGVKGPGSASLTGTIDGFDITSISDGYRRSRMRAVRMAGRRPAGQYPALRAGPFPIPRREGGACGEFRVIGHIDNGKLDYPVAHRAADGKAPLRPPAEKIDGSIVRPRAWNPC